MAAFVFILVGGCSNSSPEAQVVDGSSSTASRPKITSGRYVARRGDSLYSVAKRFGWNWKALAQSNGIPAPYSLKIGQVIYFDGHKSTQIKGSSAIAYSTVSKSSSVPTKPVHSPSNLSAQSSTGWRWPTQGLVIARYASNGGLNKGIDIAGKLGQPVVAASGGTVVYAGSGLRGYGELIIIKHNNSYVSAYGHNSKLLVHEKQQVKAGQHIADMGSTGTDKVKLHFEIRLKGKPADPLKYLPKS
ncbi:UNVERIFIED_CONTAM: hypothetical protein GTU68_010979 [Idotea baltica]|nr:hypothetical protein [Idotea baltica]